MLSLHLCHHAFPALVPEKVKQNVRCSIQYISIISSRLTGMGIAYQ